jgi:hypothetical protein
VLPSASGSTNAPCGNASGYPGARRAEARCARLRRQPRRGHVAWERRQPRRGCAADRRAKHARARRPQAARCAGHRGRAGRTRAAPGRGGCEGDRAMPGELRSCATPSTGHAPRARGPSRAGCHTVDATTAHRAGRAGHRAPRRAMAAPGDREGAMLGPGRTARKGYTGKER